MVRFHEGALHEILHVLHRDGAAFALLRARHRALDARDEAVGLLVVQNLAHAGEGRAHGALDLAGLVGFHGAVALGNLHDVVSPFVLRLRCVLRATIVSQYVTKIATYWGTDRQRPPHRRRQLTRRARKKRQATQGGRLLLRAIVLVGADDHFHGAPVPHDIPSTRGSTVSMPNSSATSCACGRLPPRSENRHEQCTPCQARRCGSAAGV